MGVIIVDAAIGSRELVKPLQALGLPAELGHMPAGDVAFLGRGWKGAETAIGVELKKISELVGSLQSGRLPLDQAPKLLKAFDHAWIVVEGAWRTQGGRLYSLGRGGRIRPTHGHMTGNELEKRMLTLELGMTVPGERYLRTRYVTSRQDTLRFLVCLYRWWTDQDQDQHKTHIGIYRPPTLIEISQFRQTVATLPGIGVKRSRDVEEHFKGELDQAFAAPLSDWIKILGTLTGTRVYQILHARPRPGARISRGEFR